jgi:sulfur relay (sulfurtransferase) DsrF/TusC family protein
LSSSSNDACQISGCRSIDSRLGGLRQMGRTSELLLGDAVSKALNKQKPEEIPPPAQ